MRLAPVSAQTNDTHAPLDRVISRTSLHTVTLSQRVAALISLLAFTLQPILASAQATRVIPDVALNSLMARESAQNDNPSRLLSQLRLAQGTDAHIMATTPPDDDDGGILSIIAALKPRKCVLTATPTPASIGATLTLTVTGCTSNPNSYVWTGAGIATGQTTTVPTLSVTAPGTPNTYAYAVVARRQNIPSDPVNVSVPVIVPPPPTFTLFNATPIAVGAGQNPQITFTVSGQSALQYFYGSQSVNPTAIAGNSYTFPSPGAEGVFLLRVQATNAGGTTERSVLVAVSAPPSPDLVAVPTSTVNVGTIAGAFAVTDSGAAAYTIPIQIPPGTAGMQPSLAFSYSSQGGNGTLGIGWSLTGLSAVTRCPKTLAQDGVKNGINYDTNANNDAFCLDGERLVQVATKTDTSECGTSCIEYRTERDAFSRVYRFDDPITVVGPLRFRVYTKSGQVLDYGSRFLLASLGWAERQDCRPTPANPTGICQPIDRANVAKMWLLDRVSDRVGNRMDIDYEGDVIFGPSPGVALTSDQAVAAFPPTEPRVSEIRYTLNASGKTYQRVKFAYSQRLGSDQHRAYDQGGGESLLSRKLDTVQTYTGASATAPTGTLVKEYRLAYGYGSYSGRMRLNSIQECDGSSNLCLPATSFDWTDTTSPGFNGAGSAPNLFPGGDSNAFKEFHVADITGDGRTDLMRRYGSGRASFCTSTPTNIVTCGFSDPSIPITSHDQWLVADFTGDGKADLLGLGGTPGDRIVICPMNSAGTGLDPCTQTSVPGATDGYMLQGDFNGDGRIDFMFYRGFGTDVAGNLIYKFDLHLSTGSGLAAAIALQLLRDASGPTSGIDLGKLLVVGDFDGDGRADIAQKRTLNDGWSCINDPLNVPGKTDCQWRVYFADFGPTTGGFVAPSGWTEGSLFTADRSTLGDFNGDGLADVATPIKDAVGTFTGQWQVCLSTGEGSFSRAKLDANLNATYVSTCHIISGLLVGGLDNVLLGDFNGDGRTDMATQVSQGAWKVCLTRGNTVVDASGNNAPELTSIAFFCGTGNWATQLYFNGIPREMVRVGDFNGDGRSDLIAGHDNTSPGSVSLAFANGDAPDMLVRITTGMKATTDVKYAPITDAAVYSKGSPSVIAGEEIVIQSPLFVVARTDASTALPSAYFTTQYRYEGLKGNINGRGILGFAKREVFENQTSSTVGAPTDTSKTIHTIIDYNQAWPFAGRPNVVTKKAINASGAEIFVNQITNTWKARLGASVSAGTPATLKINQVYLSSSVARQWELTGDELPQTSITNSDPTNIYGNVESMTLTTTDGHSKTTTNQYTDDVTRWMLGRLTQSTVRSALPNATAQTRTATFSYNTANTDPNGHGCIKGMICAESVEPNSSDLTHSATTTYSYDVFGNRIRAEQSFRDGTPNRWTTTVFDGDGRFPIQVSNTLGHSEYRRHNPRFGGLECVLSPNLIKVMSTYDGFGRRVAETTKSYLSATTCDATADGGSAPNVTTVGNSLAGWSWVNPADFAQGYRVTASTSSGAVSKTTFDNLQRPILQETRAFDGTSFAAAFTAYDSLGRKNWTKAHVAGTGGATNLVAVVTAYDNLNRPIQDSTLKPAKDPATWLSTGQPAGDVFTAVSTVYSAALATDGFGISSPRAQVSVTRQGQSGPQTTVRQVNSQGQTIRVIDAAGKSTTYQHDHFDNLTKTTDPTGIVVAMSYDLRGRKRTLSDPDVLPPTPAGLTWSYSYNGAGELVSQIDGRGWQTTLSYDQLGRNFQRIEYGAAGGPVETDWTFDACSQGIGKVCQVFNKVNGNANWSRLTDYDQFGRAFRSTTTTNGASYIGHTLFDRNSRVRIVAYPQSTPTDNPLNLKHDYNNDPASPGGGGFVWRVSDLLNGTVYWQTDAATAGRYLDGKFLKGKTGATVTEKGYDEIGRVALIKAGPATTPTSIQNATFKFDAIGNLANRADPSAALTQEAFTYDAVNRLTTTSTTPATAATYTRSFGYDDAGNLISRSDLPGLCASVAGKITYGIGHRVACADGRSYQYDGNGNVTADGLRTLTNYTPFNLPSSPH